MMSPSGSRRAAMRLLCALLVLGSLRLGAVPQSVMAASDVGTGTPESCTSTAVADALAQGGSVSFNCGPTPVTIVVPVRQIAMDTAIDGGGLVTLSGGDTNRVFVVASDVHLSLTNIAIAHGRTSNFGGAIYAKPGSSLTLDHVAVTDSQANQGGAIYLEHNTTAVWNQVTIARNVANSGGGVVNNGSLTWHGGDLANNEVVAFPEPTWIYGAGFFNNLGGTTQLTNLTIAENSAPDLSSYGGGIANHGGTVTISNSTLRGNSANYGAAIQSSGGWIEGTNLTIVENRARSSAAVWGSTSGGAQIGHFAHTLIAYNTSRDGTGGIGGGRLWTVANSIVALNTAYDRPDCDSGFQLEGINLVGVTTSCLFSGNTAGLIRGEDPRLGGLADNGGPTQTHTLMPGSPAIDAARDASATCPANDQRGTLRPAGVFCDLGPVELTTTEAPLLATPPRHVLPTEQRLGTSTIPVEVHWSGLAAAGVRRFQLEQSTNGGAYTRVSLASPTATSAVVMVATTGIHRFRTRVIDTTGAISPWAYDRSFRYDVIQETSRSIWYSASPFPSRTVRYASGGTLRGAAERTPGYSYAPTAEFRFYGSSIAWVADRTPARGIAVVWLDGEIIGEVDLYSATTKGRQIVFARNSLDPTVQHTLIVTVMEQKNPASTGTYVAIDAFVVGR